MKVENLTKLMSGSFVLTGVALSRWVDPNWIWLAVFAGVGLIQSVFTGFCVPSWWLGRIGWVDDQGVIRRPQK
ncbi:MAG: hypothetical protein RL639_841 [Verrucomicrobiota bacterium]|jgi:hypothetical protein